jgi:hypothetical protein
MIKLNTTFRREAKPQKIMVTRQMPNILSCTFTNTLDI